MGDKKPNKYGCWLIFAVLFSIGVFFFFFVEVGTARNAVESNKCRKDLGNIGLAIQSHVNQTGDLPRDAKGQFSLASLPIGPTMSSHWKSCVDSFITAPDFTLEQFHSSRPTVMICDRPGNHVLRHSSGRKVRENGIVQEQAHFLMSTGFVAIWRGDSTELAAWSETFQNKLTDQPPQSDY